VLTAAAAPARALDNGLARTPPMGWNPWYRFGCAVNEQLITQTADAIVSSGMAAAGYRYVNLDDCWMAKTRDNNGALQPDPARFPHGMQALADYVHSRGLKLGIYLDAGTATCAGYPGSAGHLAQDATTIADWGIDYLKMDWCNTGNQDPSTTYATVRDALAASGHPVLLSICDWGLGKPWAWGPQTGNMWRTAGDYTWYGAPQSYWKAVLAVADQTAALGQYAHPGAWNDPDILLTGVGVLTPAEERSQLSLWSMMAAPLLAGPDVRTMSPTIRRTLMNRDVIAVDQDSAGVPGVRVGANAIWQVWIRQLSGNARALLMLNTTATTSVRKVSARSLGLPAAAHYRVQTLWGRHRAKLTPDWFTVRARPHDVAMFRVTPR
jgi:alpha-galactosidase